LTSVIDSDSWQNTWLLKYQKILSDLAWSPECYPSVDRENLNNGDPGFGLTIAKWE